MRRIVLFVLTCIALLLSADPLFAEQNFTPVYAAVLRDKVNIRAGCGLNFEILGQLNKGDRVVAAGKEYGWYKIKLPKQALSFVHKDYVNCGVVEVNKLRVRAGAGVNFNVLGTLKEGETVNILEERESWLKIVPPDNCLGWVKQDYLKLLETRASPQKSKPSLLKENKQSKIEVYGQINDLGKIVNRRGTHKLVAGGKIVYYLKSENINLDRYVYQKARVIGKLEGWEDSTYPVINVEQIKAE